MVSEEFTKALAIYVVILAITIPTAAIVKMQAPFPNGALASSSPASGPGAASYAIFCASCHGPLGSSSKLGRTAAQISAAISSIGAMNSLSSLNTTQIQAIADALANPSANSPGISSGSTSPLVSPALAGEGASLYAAYCAGCHSQLMTSAKLGRSASQITAAISSVSAMSGLTSLNASQINAIAAALANPSATPLSGGPTPPPADLYATYCSSCHGPLASSNVAGATASDISGAIRETRAMRNLTWLSSSQLQAIASALQSAGGGRGANNGGMEPALAFTAFQMCLIPLTALALVATALVARKKGSGARLPKLC